MASISKVKIGNLALSHIGAKATIESFSEDSAEAQNIDLWYDFARESVLQAFDWSFARKKDALASHSVDPDTTEWSYRYQYPADCIAARYILNPLGKDADAVPFEMREAGDGTKSILTDQESAKLVYTQNIETTSLFTPNFVMTLSYYLASLISFSLTGKLTLKEAMENQYMKWLFISSGNNGNEEVSQDERDAVWIRAR